MSRKQNVRPRFPSLAQLRQDGYAQQEILSPQWQEVRAGHLRKVYRARSYWTYTPVSIQGKTVKCAPDIAKLFDERSLDDLRGQAEETLRQLLYRALAGDSRAVALYAGLLSRGTDSLAFLATQQTEKVQAEAEKQPCWPVLLSLNPQELKWAKNYLRRLHVGEKATTPTRPGQRRDPHNFWTALATEALNVCQANRRVWVPGLTGALALCTCSLDRGLCGRSSCRAASGHQGSDFPTSRH
jgi:hypothetical protein